RNDADPIVTDCGTPGTPPCPPPDTFLPTRAALIDALAGPDTTTERRRGVTRYVDTFLLELLQNVTDIIVGTNMQPPGDPIQINIVEGVEGVTVGPGTAPSPLAAVFNAFKVQQLVVDGQPAAES